jgi:secreted trypsin-like serine protease
MKLIIFVFNLFLLICCAQSQVNAGNKDGLDDFIDMIGNPNEDKKKEEPYDIEDLFGSKSNKTDNFDNVATGNVPSDFPTMLSVVNLDKNKKYVGALIHPSVVLTTAHCVKGSDASSIEVEGPDARRNVKEIIIHPNFYRGALKNNIALLTLQSSIPESENTKLARLPIQGMSFQNTNGILTVSNSQRLDLPIIPEAECETKLRASLGNRYSLDSSHFCAGGKSEREICLDEGSLLVSQNDQNSYLVTGLTTFRVSCRKDNVPTVFVKVSLFREWINKQLSDREINLK